MKKLLMTFLNIGNNGTFLIRNSKKTIGISGDVRLSTDLYLRI